MERQIAYIALFAALIAALGGFLPPIPTPIGVPVTAQTLGVMLAGTIWVPSAVGLQLCFSSCW